MGQPELKIVGGIKNIGDEELRQWLEKYIEEHPHLDTKILQRTDHIGASRTALDAYLDGTYFLPKEQGGQGVNPENSKIEKLIRAYREKVEGVVIAGQASGYLETRLWQQFQYLVNTAIKEKAIVVGYGKPGAGKSRALRQYKTEKMTTMPIEILCSANITPRYFAEKIATELGLDFRVSLAKLEDMIAEKLKKGAPRLLFVDQANYLNEKALGTVCYIWEKTKIPIVLIGTKDLYNLFTTSSLTEDVRQQLSSRIAWHCNLTELGIEEVKSIVFDTFGEYASNIAVKQIFDLTGGNHRHLEMILPRIAAIIEKNKDALQDGSVEILALIQKAGRRIMIG